MLRRVTGVTCIYTRVMPKKKASDQPARWSLDWPESHGVPLDPLGCRVNGRDY